MKALLVLTMCVRYFAIVEVIPPTTAYKKRVITYDCSHMTEIRMEKMQS